jgi:diadenosine tetraphosphatase ApaH/serine/threonine PP2A family protein phosphatase
VSAHLCHAEGCQVEVPPRLLMCRRHWRMVPPPLQDAVWANYRRGQERRKDPTPEYMAAARAAIEAVAEREGRALRLPFGEPS